MSQDFFKRSVQVTYLKLHFTYANIIKQKNEKRLFLLKLT